jgi:hypothetical protein
VAKDGSLHLVFHIYAGDPREARGHSAGYLRSRDGGKSWETAEGAGVKLPVTPKSRCFIQQGPKLDLRTGNVVLDPDGRPWLTVWHLGRSPRTVRLYHHDGEAWRSRDPLPFVRKRLGECEMVMGTVTFDHDGALYVAAAVKAVGGPKSDWFGHPSKEVVLLSSSDRGRTFAVRRLSQPDPTQPNWLPSIERPFGPRPIGVPSLIYTHGDKGEFGRNREGTPTEVLFVHMAK